MAWIINNIFKRCLRFGNPFVFRHEQSDDSPYMLSNDKSVLILIPCTNSACN